MKWVECPLNIAAGLLDQLENIVRHSSGHEVCGFLYGDCVLPLKNVSNNPKLFRADPPELAHALALRGEPYAIFHTHPAGKLIPSVADVNEWHYPGSLMLIAGFRDGALQVKSYQMACTGGRASLPAESRTGGHEGRSSR